MRHQGRLQDWNDDKGFGFVTPHGGGDRAFVHIKAFVKAPRRPMDGDVITYTLDRDAQGRLRASEVRLAAVPTREDDRARPGMIGPTFALLFCATLLGMVLVGQLPFGALLAYAGMSGAAFLAYWRDKAAAQAGDQRTPEDLLQFLALACGWPGALLAQRMFRHKSRKQSFQTTFWGAVTMNVIALGVYASDTGRAWLAGLVA